MGDRHALIVDDTPTNKDFFERLLTQAGFSVQGAGDGKTAMELASQMSALDLAILDMEVPHMNGLEMTARLRKTFPDMCIVVATMHDEHSLMHSAFKRGCDVFMVKPHGFMTLFKAVTNDGHTQLRAQRPQIIDQYGMRAFRSALS
ncbi:MAG: response regulator [Chloroflexota bacterium]